MLELIVKKFQKKFLREEFMLSEEAIINGRQLFFAPADVYL